MSTRGLTSASSMLYIVVLSAIASASDVTATAQNPRCLSSRRAERPTCSKLTRMASGADDAALHGARGDRDANADQRQRKKQAPRGQARPARLLAVDTNVPVPHPLAER